MFKKLSLRTKLISTLHLSILTICVIFLIFGIYHVNNFLKKDIAINNRVAKEHFEAIKNRDINMLSASIVVFGQDEKIKKIYLEQDREKLYEAVKPLFDKLKSENVITQLHFIDTEGKVFLRMHKKDDYGDIITRDTFKKAKNLNTVAAGIELGKTSYSLRVVCPYYYNDKIIGYIEMAEEISHFIDLIKEEGRLIYVAPKSQIKKEDYLKVYGDGNYGWNYFNNYVIVSKLPTDIPWQKCVTEQNISTTGGIFSDSKRIDVNGKVYSCGSFPIYVGKKNSGYVFTIKDMSERNFMANDVINQLVILCFIICLLFAISIILIFNRSFRYYNNIIYVLDQIKKGNYDVKLPVYCYDEIGKASEHINAMCQEIKSQKEQLKKFNEHLLLEDKTKNEFISLASHELLTPTAVIEGYSAMILNDKMAKLPAKAKDYLVKIFAASKRLAHLSEEMLMISRLDEKQVKVINSSFDIIELIKKNIDNIKPLVKEKKLHLVFNPKVEKLIIYNDADKINQIISNLLTNAVSYSDQGTIKIECRKIKDGKGGFIEISVSDQGIGIAEEEKENIFKKFSRTFVSSDRTERGIGLGLYISKQYAKMAGGDLIFTSKIGKGSIFTLKIKIINK